MVKRTPETGCRARRGRPDQVHAGLDQWHIEDLGIGIERARIQLGAAGVRHTGFGLAIANDNLMVNCFVPTYGSTDSMTFWIPRSMEKSYLPVAASRAS